MRLSPARATLWIAIPLLLAVVAACGEDGEEGARIITPTEARFTPLIISSDLAVGPNRFVVGLIDREQDAIVLNAQLHFRFFKVKGEQEELRSEIDATPITIASSYTHMHENGTMHEHEVGKVGVYVANVEFDSAGDWAVEVSGSASGQALEPLLVAFPVREESLSVAVGEPAPRSLHATLDDVQDLSEICTSDPPNPDMHRVSIAEAAASGRPTVIVFATPAFCTSRICGPTKDVVDKLFQEYQGEANFVHVEPYNIEKARSGQGLEVIPFLEDEWGLRTEPWVFVLDAEGKIAAKFEGVVSLQELESALKPLLDTRTD